MLALLWRLRLLFIAAITNTFSPIVNGQAMLFMIMLTIKIAALKRCSVEEFISLVMFLKSEVVKFAILWDNMQ